MYADSWVPANVDIDAQGNLVGFGKGCQEGVQ